MQLGRWEIRECMAGRFRLDGGAMFGVVPKTLWSKLLKADNRNTIAMALRTLLASGEGKVILVDSGSGSGYGEKLEKIYQFEGDGGLKGALEAHGLTPADVTDVIVTHLHFDHGGGLVEPDGRGWRLAFPNAVHHVHKAQWLHALSPTPRDGASYFRERIEIIETGGVLQLHDSGWTPAPGLEIMVVNGHTPGQQLLRVCEGGQTLLYCGDLVPTSAHIPVPYIMAYDLNPVLAMEEKEKVLERAAEEGWILFFEHDPDIAACRVKKEGKHFVAGERVRL